MRFIVAILGMESKLVKTDFETKCDLVYWRHRAFAKRGRLYITKSAHQ
jgi:hypothetical protein